jgi:hypothetical protein
MVSGFFPERRAASGTVNIVIACYNILADALPNLGRARTARWRIRVGGPNGIRTRATALKGLFGVFRYRLGSLSIVTLTCPSRGGPSWSLFELLRAICPSSRRPMIWGRSRLGSTSTPNNHLFGGRSRTARQGGSFQTLGPATWSWLLPTRLEQGGAARHDWRPSRVAAQVFEEPPMRPRHGLWRDVRPARRPRVGASGGSAR